MAACFYESSKEGDTAKLFISIFALILSFTAFFITRMDKNSRDNYEISQIYFNEAKEVLSKSINGICEESKILIENWKAHTYSLTMYSILKNKIENPAHIDSLSIHEKNSRNKIISYLTTGNKGGKVEASQLLHSEITQEEFLEYIIPVYLFVNTDNSHMTNDKRKEEDIVNITNSIKSLPDSSVFYSFTAALLSFKD